MKGSYKAPILQQSQTAKIGTSRCRYSVKTPGKTASTQKTAQLRLVQQVEKGCKEVKCVLGSCAQWQHQG